MRVTEKVLNERLEQISEKSGDYMKLNYASCYGGWQLTRNNGSQVIRHRCSAREMLAFLDGMLDGLTTYKPTPLSQLLESYNAWLDSRGIPHFSMDEHDHGDMSEEDLKTLTHFTLLWESLELTQ